MLGPTGFARRAYFFSRTQIVIVVTKIRIAILIVAEENSGAKGVGDDVVWVDRAEGVPKA